MNMGERAKHTADNSRFKVVIRGVWGLIGIDDIVSRVIEQAARSYHVEISTAHLFRDQANTSRSRVKLVRLSAPLSVIKTSSSMRTPISPGR